MVIDFSNPVWFVIGVFAAALVLVGFGLYVKSILVDAQVEAARKIRAEEEEAKRNDKPNLGRKI